MIEFVCTAPTSVRIAIWVAMVTMHFHIAQMSLILEHFFRIQGGGGAGKHLTSMKNCPGDARWIKLDTGVQRHIVYIEIAFCILA